jgi:hypothetical protein
MVTKFNSPTAYKEPREMESWKLMRELSLFGKKGILEDR